MSTTENQGLLICGQCKLPRHALVQDIRSLILNYLRKNSTELTEFAATWKELEFSLIHYACTDIHGRQVFMEFLYSQVLEYLLATNSIFGRVAVIYALYFLHESQPKSPKIYPIPLTETYWLELKHIYVMLCEQQQSRLNDATLALYHILTRNMVHFVAVNPYSLTFKNPKASPLHNPELVRLTKQQEAIEEYILNETLFDHETVEPIQQLSAQYAALKSQFDADLPAPKPEVSGSMIYSPTNLLLFKEEETPAYLEAVKSQQSRLVAELRKELAQSSFSSSFKPQQSPTDQSKSHPLPFFASSMSTSYESRTNLRNRSYTNRISTPLAKTN